MAAELQTNESKLAEVRGVLDKLHAGFLKDITDLKTELEAVKTDREALRTKYLGLLEHLKQLAEGAAAAPTAPA